MKTRRNGKNFTNFHNEKHLSISSIHEYTVHTKMCWCSHNKGLFHLPRLYHQLSHSFAHSIDIPHLLAVEFKGENFRSLVMMALTLYDEFIDIHTLEKVDLISDYLTDRGANFCYKY